MKAWVRQKAAEVKAKGRNKAAWYCHWKEPDGTRRARSCGTGAKGKQNANKLAAELHSALVSGSYRGDPSLVMWPAFVAEYKRVELTKKSGPHAEVIRGTLARFESIMKPRRLTEITTRFIDQFVAKRSQDRGLKKGSKISPATVNIDLRNLKLVLNLAVEWKQLEQLPKFKMLKAPTRLKRFVTTEHLAAMMVAASEMTDPEVRNASSPDYWRAILAFAFVTGWRINEILSIHRDDVDFEACRVKSRWSDSKGKKDELIHLPEPVIDLLRPIWQSFSEQPLSWGKSRRRLYVPFSELQKKAGIKLSCPDDHEHTDACHLYGFHDFRRAFATYNAQNLSPAQLQRLMKHSSFTTTQGYIDYARVMTEKADVFVPDSLKKSS